MTTKHTKGYAEKLAQKQSSSTNEYTSVITEAIFVNGYMKAIEETNAAELFKALEKFTILDEKYFLSISGLIKNAREVIKKATI
jgi:hypothetical protein